MAVSVRCPKCETVLRTANPPTPGKKVKCPRCAGIFIPDADDDDVMDSTAVKANPDRSSPSPSRKVRDENDDDEPRSRRSRRDDSEDDDEPRRGDRRKRRRDDDEDDRPRSRKKKNQGAGLLIGAGIGGSVLLLLLVVGAVVLMTRGPNNGAKPIAQGPAGPAPAPVIAGVPAPVPQDPALVAAVPAAGGGVPAPAAPITKETAKAPEASVPQPPSNPATKRSKSPRGTKGSPNPAPQAPPQAAPPANVEPPPAVQAAPLEAATDLPKDILDKTSRATVFIRVDAGGQVSTGSGFLVKTSGDMAYVVTNDHVINVGGEPAASQRKRTQFKKGFKSMGPPKEAYKGKPQFPHHPFMGKGGLGGPFGQPAPQKVEVRVTVVLHHGMPEEQSVPASVVAYDEEADLAVLRITGVRNLPAPLDVSQEASVAELQSVYIFGFPLGKAPINVGKGTISGIRRDTNNEASEVHINCQLQPGHSGGPVVDAQGRLVGVSVATLVGQRLGFVVPAVELSQLFKGRLQMGAVYSLKQQGTVLNVNGEVWVHDRKSTVRDKKVIVIQVPGEGPPLNIPPNLYLVYARLSDPMLKINGAAMHWAVADRTPDRPEGQQSWPKLPQSQQITLKIQDQNAFGELRLPTGAVADQTFAFQFSYVNAEKQTVFTQPHLVRLTFPQNINLATLNISGIPDDPTRRYVEDSLPKWFTDKPRVKSRFKDSIEVEFESVADLKALVAKITFGNVTSVQGRTVAVTLKKLELPLPDAAEVSQAIADLKSTDAKRWRTAADQLAKAYQPLPDRRVEVAKALEERVNDPDVWLSKAVLAALSLWSGPENVPALARVLEHKDVFTRRAALEILAKYKDPSTAGGLAKLLPSGFDRGEASKILKSIGPPAEKAILPFVSHKDGWVAREACSILKEIGTGECVPALTEAANSNNNFVSPVARDALATVQARKR